MRYCPSCHKQCGDFEEFCTKCGTKTEELVQDQAVKNNWCLYLILSIIAFFFASKICSVIGIIFSIFMKNNYEQNKIKEYLSNQKVVQVTLIINAVILVLNIILSIIIGSAFIKYFFFM